MGMNRRQAVFASIAALTLGGCRGARSARTSGGVPRPTTDWGTAGRPAGSPFSNGTPVAPPRVAPAATVRPDTTPVNTTSLQTVPAVARSEWTSTGPIAGRVNPMNGISKITVHHEGWTSVYFTDRNTTAARIEQIRNVHVRDRRWGDIGYHYIVDRAGTVWEGRALTSQGAHVSENNEHNAGILVLGNFDKQTPSTAQLRALVATVARLKQAHRVDVRDIKSHQEINATACPGANLQRQMDTLRRSV